MANEIQVACTLQYSNTAPNIPIVNRTLNVNLNAAGSGRYASGVQRCTTSPTALDLNGIATLGVMWLHNLDLVNDVLVRPASGAADAVRLKPGDPPALIRLATNTPYVSSSASTCDLEYFVTEG